ncbi:MAG: phosphohistidine phosphatase SixA [Thermosynechococcaceae cyanobacterium MS004]|nr:phosphohistidine phosphatase SixA [Thermosynechococcaceae cyanobacterium MS004]
MPIALYLIRHGIATERDSGIDDRDRPLTPKGRQKAQAIAQQLKALGLDFDEILTSPLLRATQTAEILLGAGLSAQMSITHSLAPLGSFSDWLAWLRGYDAERQNQKTTIALVGHEPDLSQWAELLLWGESRGVLQLKKGGILGLNIADPADPLGNSILFWLTPPRFLVSS